MDLQEATERLIKTKKKHTEIITEIKEIDKTVRDMRQKTEEEIQPLNQKKQLLVNEGLETQGVLKHYQQEVTDLGGDPEEILKDQGD